MSAADQPDRTPWKPIALVVLLLVVPLPQAASQSLVQHACQQAQDSTAPSPGSTGVGPVDECLGSGDDGDDLVPADPQVGSDTARASQDLATAPPGATGYPLIPFSGTGDKQEPAKVRVTEPRIHSILVEDVRAFEQLAVQFVPAKTPDVGRVSPCLAGGSHTQAGDEAGAEGDGSVHVQGGASPRVFGVELGSAHADVRLFPENGYCAAVDASARASVDRALFGNDQEVASCTALACEFQTKDRASPEQTGDERGTALFGPLMLYPGRWQVVRTGPEDLAFHVGQHLSDSPAGMPACDNPVVVLCFDVEPCVNPRDVVGEAPNERTCPEGLGPGTPPSSYGGSSGPDQPDCSTRRDTSGSGVDYRWKHCRRKCDGDERGTLVAGNREVDWHSWTGSRGGSIFEAAETWSARSHSTDSDSADRCNVEDWTEADVAEVGLAVSGPQKLSNRYSDTWNVTLHGSVRECHRPSFPMRDTNETRCHDAILKKPVIVVPDYKETRDDRECDPFQPPFRDQAECVRLAIDAEVTRPHHRDRTSLYHTGGDGELMPASRDDSRVEAPALACVLAGHTIGLLTGGVAANLVGIGCDVASLADALSSSPREQSAYRELQDSFSAESGYSCSGACWYLNNRLESNEGSDAKRDQMAFGAMVEMRSCGEGRAGEFVAGTYLKGLAYHGPTGRMAEAGGDPTNRSAGHHYWGPGLTVRSRIPVDVGDRAPSCG